ncbi:MAG: hypothetical protein JWM11_449, partial [Planctomycetaceae bacterium]|nr:hypothetical protein [Planctomycetaceae bacterium]
AKNAWAAAQSSPQATLEAAVEAANATRMSSETQTFATLNGTLAAYHATYLASLAPAAITYVDTLADDDETASATTADAFQTECDTEVDDAYTYSNTTVPLAQANTNTQLDDSLTDLVATDAASQMAADSIANDAETDFDVGTAAVQTAVDTEADDAEAEMVADNTALANQVTQGIAALSSWVASVSAIDAVKVIKDSKPSVTVPTGTGTRIPIPKGSLVFVSDSTTSNDASRLWWQAPRGTKIKEGVSSWTDLEENLKAVPDGSLPAVVLSGHGGGAGGIATSDGQHLTFQNMPNSVRDLLNRKLAPDGKLINLGCSQGGCANGMTDLATKIGHPTVGNTGSVSYGNYGEGNWVEFPAKTK